MAWYYIPPEVAKDLAPYVLPIIWISAMLGGIFLVVFGLLMIEYDFLVSSLVILLGIGSIYTSAQEL